jgi:hypothetical protein
MIRLAGFRAFRVSSKQVFFQYNTGVSSLQVSDMRHLYRARGRCTSQRFLPHSKGHKNLSRKKFSGYEDDSRTISLSSKNLWTGRPQEPAPKVLRREVSITVFERQPKKLEKPLLRARRFLINPLWPSA